YGGGNEPPQFTPNQPIPTITNNQPTQPLEFVEVSSSLETAGDLLTKGSAVALTTIALSTIIEPSIELPQEQIVIEPSIELTEEEDLILDNVMDLVMPGKPVQELAQRQMAIEQTIEQQLEL